MEAENAMSHEADELENAQEEGSNRIAWFVTGVLLGATVAILYAPKSGKDAREFVTAKAQCGKEAVTAATETVTDKSKDIAEASRDMFERGRKVVEDAAELFERARKLVRG
jgi:gas vesicle protein